MFPAGCGKSLKRTLHDSLATDINPRAGGHLAIHRQPYLLEAIELTVIVPLSHEIRIRDQDARCFIVGPKFADRLSRLNEKRFVIFQLAERPNNRIESFPASRGATSPAV